MKKLIFLGFFSLVFFSTHAFAQTNASGTDCITIIQSMIDIIGKPAPKDCKQQYGVFYREVKYGDAKSADAKSAAYMYSVNDNGIVTKAMLFASYTAMYDALNTSLAWVIQFSAEDDVLKIPMDKKQVFLYKKHFVTINLSDDSDAQIIVHP
jgi:hypothetical protein